MRNWNPTIHSYPAGRLSLPAYLWGIETVIESMQWDMVDQLPAYLWGIETGIPDKQVQGIARYQPTYEELKQQLYVPGRFSVRSVTSLPMRNWNMTSNMIISP